MARDRPLDTPGDQARRTVNSADRVRDTLALVTVVGFLGITAVLAIVFPLIGLASPDSMIAYLKDLSSIYAGIVGLIIGYYFGKR
jgi:hypothetical protein